MDRTSVLPSLAPPPLKACKRCGVTEVPYDVWCYSIQDRDAVYCWDCREPLVIQRQWDLLARQSVPTYHEVMGFSWAQDKRQRDHDALDHSKVQAEQQDDDHDARESEYPSLPAGYVRATDQSISAMCRR